MKWENLLLFPFFGIIAFPWLALVPAVAFAAAFFWRRRKSALILPLLWIVSIVAVVQLFRRKRPDAAA